VVIIAISRSQRILGSLGRGSVESSKDGGAEVPVQQARPAAGVELVSSEVLFRLDDVSSLLKISTMLGHIESPRVPSSTELGPEHPSWYGQALSAASLAMWLKFPGAVANIVARHFGQSPCADAVSARKSYLFE